MPFVNKRWLVASTYSTSGLLRLFVSGKKADLCGVCALIRAPNRDKRPASHRRKQKAVRRYQTLRIHSLFFLYSMSVNRVLAMFFCQPHGSGIAHDRVTVQAEHGRRWESPRATWECCYPLRPSGPWNAQDKVELKLLALQAAVRSHRSALVTTSIFQLTFPPFP